MRLRVLLIASVLSTAACPKRFPLPDHLRVSGIEELGQRMAAARVPTDAFSAEVRLTYFGPKGRVRGTAAIAVMRPSSLRYELQGPHGGVLEAFATDGRELQLLDQKGSRFLYGPATRENINQLLALVPLGLGPSEWVSLLFGEIGMPLSATLVYDDKIGRYVGTWTDQDLTHRVEVDPESARATRATISAEGTLLSEIRILERDAAGLPVELELNAPAADVGVEVKLRDVSHDVTFDASVFILDAPRSITPEYLGSQ